MLDQSRNYSYSYGSTPRTSSLTTTTHHTSSAFSPSANPNEDWTKISDLAERRRIQNRIAQRNYRKKLKKRLEDLERRAASSSASPEQSPDEDDGSPIPRRSPSHDAIKRSTSSTKARTGHRRQISSPELSPPLVEDKSMFSRQHTRQISASPPPFAYAPFSSFEMSTTAIIPQAAPLSPPYLSSDPQLYQTYPTTTTTTTTGLGNPWQPRHGTLQRDLYGDDEMSPFGMSYANMAGVDVPYTGSYGEQPLIPTPDLSDTCEYFMGVGERSPEYLTSFSLSAYAVPLTPPHDT